MDQPASVESGQSGNINLEWFKHNNVGGGGNLEIFPQKYVIKLLRVFLSETIFISFCLFDRKQQKVK